MTVRYSWPISQSSFPTRKPFEYSQSLPRILSTCLSRALPRPPYAHSSKSFWLAPLSSANRVTLAFKWKVTSLPETFPVRELNIINSFSTSLIIRGDPEGILICLARSGRSLAASSAERVPSMLALATVAVQSSKICLSCAYSNSSRLDFAINEFGCIGGGASVKSVYIFFANTPRSIHLPSWPAAAMGEMPGEPPQAHRPAVDPSAFRRRVCCIPAPAQAQMLAISAAPPGWELCRFQALP